MPIKLTQSEYKHITQIREMCVVKGKHDWNLAVDLVKAYASEECKVDENSPNLRERVINEMFNRYIDAIAYGYEVEETLFRVKLKGLACGMYLCKDIDFTGEQIYNLYAFPQGEKTLFTAKELDDVSNKLPWLNLANCEIEEVVK